ncbi:siderophore-interacting protein [Tabrizicola soli]|uniref:Siderophore-interacting protein n=1 Tax=Tabrizicola soli TaxID=2185115 RepID=A0ABV7E195_9RHOB|nr:siderophore-interacting protein [Tabrizicola soli]
MARPQGRPGNHALAQVVEAQRISPSYTRVTVAGPELARFASGGLHFRLLFGPSGAGWPGVDTNGVTEWPQGAAAWHKPVYTTRKLWNPDGIPHLSFDVFMHEGGHVAGWCSSVGPGTEVVLAGPGGGKTPQHGGWHGFVGDETAVPVISRLLAEMPLDAGGTAVLVVPCAADVQPLDHPRGVSVHWITRDKGGTPLAGLDMLDIPDGPRSVFFAAEAAEAQSARKILAGRGLNKSEISSAAYWTRT